MQTCDGAEPSPQATSLLWFRDQLVLPFLPRPVLLAPDLSLYTHRYTVYDKEVWLRQAAQSVPSWRQQAIHEHWGNHWDLAGVMGNPWKGNHGILDGELETHLLGCYGWWASEQERPD